jgi:hypothetical protein
MIRAPLVDIRRSFADFVELYGGQVTDQTIEPKPNLPENADYIFRGESVIAELKCLEEDLELKQDFINKRIALVEKWLRDKIIEPPQVSGPMIYTKELPEECQRDLKNLYGRTIKTHIRKANAQIRQSVVDFDMPAAKGLLLLANDGNYTLEPQNVLVILLRILNRDDLFPFINTIVYFTPNMAVRMPDGSIGPLWMHVWRDKSIGIPLEFLNALGAGWAAFHGKLTGRAMTMESHVNEEGIDPDNLVQGTKHIKAS